MDEITTTATVLMAAARSSNLSGEGDWWSSSGVEDDTTTLRLDEAGLWSGHFVPPPPRPIFLDESATPDGVTTCDLCTWAWHESKTFTLDAALEAPGELGWVLTLIIVSLISALIGAIVMIIALHCKRIKTNGMNDSHRAPHQRSRPPISTPDDKSLHPAAMGHFPAGSNSSSVWSWLSRRPAHVLQSQLSTPTAPVENHYTHMEETYNPIAGEEALYAELDRDSDGECVAGGERGHSPAYQNSAYTDPDAVVSSAPSSAYYSDLSVASAIPERAYEVVGLATLTPWDGDTAIGRRAAQPPLPSMRLASISETLTVPSDYV